MNEAIWACRIRNRENSILQLLFSLAFLDRHITTVLRTTGYTITYTSGHKRKDPKQKAEPKISWQLAHKPVQKDWEMEWSKHGFQLHQPSEFCKRVSREVLWKVLKNEEFVLLIFRQSRICIMGFKPVWEHMVDPRGFPYHDMFTQRVNLEPVYFYHTYIITQHSQETASMHD